MNESNESQWRATVHTRIFKNTKRKKHSFSVNSYTHSIIVTEYCFPVFVNSLSSVPRLVAQTNARGNEEMAFVIFHVGLGFGRHHFFCVFLTAHNASLIPQINRRQSQIYDTKPICYAAISFGLATQEHPQHELKPFHFAADWIGFKARINVRVLNSVLRAQKCSSSVLVFGGRMATKAIFHFVADSLCLNGLCVVQ